ncbi:MAG: prepilin peptidase [Acidobacteriota bacterium]
MQVWIAIVVGMAAVIDDLARRHIANWIPAAALAGGFGWHIGRGGWQGALTALGGTVAGFAVFLIFYLLGGMGGGDVKLMAGFGALLGAGRLLEAALWTAGIGGIMAVAVLGWKALRRSSRGPESLTAEQREREASIPYAPAIALGVWLSLVPKG